MKVGRAQEYVTYVKGLVAAREKADLDMHTAVYQMVSGGPPTTFLIFTTARSLAEWDAVAARADADQRAVEQGFGGADAARQMRMTLADTVADTSIATYAMSPEISRPMPQFVAYDAAFWGPRTDSQGGKALATQKTTRKPEEKR